MGSRPDVKSHFFFIVKMLPIWVILSLGREGRPAKGNQQCKGGKVARKPYVDKEQCISCGICIENCPRVFRFDPHGKSECFDPEGADEETIEKAAMELCPVSCIVWVE